MYEKGELLYAAPPSCIHSRNLLFHLILCCQLLQDNTMLLTVQLVAEKQNDSDSRFVRNCSHSLWFPYQTPG